MCRYPPIEVVVWGFLACFTRPEAKVERVSYPMMTPSAARGVLEAIFWKPQMRWLVREIHLLCPKIPHGAGVIPRKNFEDDPVRWHSLLRNEVNCKQSIRGAVVEKGEHYLVDEDRAQRHTLALRDVRYLIRADVEVLAGVAEDPAKYRDQFQRRVHRGQCFQRPFLGCREFACSFCPPDPEWDYAPMDVSLDLGLMLFDMRFTQEQAGERQYGVGAEPVFFEAKLEHGVLHVPPELYKEVVPVCC